MDTRNEIREFLTSRRAKLKAADVGLPDYGVRRVPGLRALHRRIRPEVAAADAGAGDADDGIGRFFDRRVGDVLDADVAGGVHHSRSHLALPFFGSSHVHYPRKHRPDGSGRPC